MGWESFCGIVLLEFGHCLDTEWPNAHFKAFCGTDTKKEDGRAALFFHIKDGLLFLLEE